jgi:hypothetical protein
MLGQMLILTCLKLGSVITSAALCTGGISPLRFLRLALFIAGFSYATAAQSQQQCLPEDLVALAKAGYSKQDIDAICKVSAAFLSRSGRADLSADAMARFIDSVTPLEIDSTASTKLELRELKYCKADDEHHAELLAYGAIRSDGLSETSRGTTLEQADCDRPLATVSKRAIKRDAPTGSGEFVARVVLDWVPWELHMQVVEIKGSGTPGLKAPSFPTNVIPVMIGNQVIPFSAAFYFFKDSISVMLAPSVDVASISDVSYVPKLDSFSAFNAENKPNLSDARVRVSHMAINYLLDTYFSGNQALIVDTGNQAIGNLTVKQLHGEPSGADRYIVSGTVYDNNGGSYSTQVTSQGADLGLDAIKIDPRLKNCPIPSSLNDINAIQCNATNAALQAGGGLLGSVLTSAYKGKLLRTFGTPDTLHLTLGKINCDVSGVVNHVATTNKYVQIDAGLSFKHP